MRRRALRALALCLIAGVGRAMGATRARASRVAFLRDVADVQVTRPGKTLNDRGGCRWHDEEGPCWRDVEVVLSPADCKQARATLLARGYTRRPTMAGVTMYGRTRKRKGADRKQSAFFTPGTCRLFAIEERWD